MAEARPGACPVRKCLDKPHRGGAGAAEFDLCLPSSVERLTAMDPAFLAIQASPVSPAPRPCSSPRGLTIVFGVTRIVNFAHGSLHAGRLFRGDARPQALALSPGPLGFWTGILAAALAVGLLGVLLEVLLLRRIYRVRAVSAPRHLRRRPRRAGSRGPDFRARGHSGPRRPACGRRRNPRPALVQEAHRGPSSGSSCAGPGSGCS